ncbi:N-6 DNA methylase [Psychrobacillus sp.]|uniref:N-6 DNA methylase n=1 Tax=Psychrobacillus sp. TaxID=1871623 RepID=UPI0028BDDEF1|nr:N-6 DNA methylase [Psychrobacillus sp.]
MDFRPNTVEDKGFFILPSQLFGNVVETSRTNENLNTDLANIFSGIEASAVGFASERDIKGLFEDNDIDAFGDAYEYLISNYARNAGKSGGKFFTPQSVSRCLARLVMDGKIKIHKVYDPPYSIKWVGNVDPTLINDERFAPAGKWFGE